MNKPLVELNDLPEEVKKILEVMGLTSGFVAQDESGGWYHHTERPITFEFIGKGLWGSNAGTSKLTYLFKLKPIEDWKATLRKLNA